VCNLTPVGGDDIFEIKLSPTGTFISAVSKGGPSDDVGKAILIDTGGDIVTTGSFQSTADFDPSSATSNLTVVSGTDIFITKLSSFALLNTDNIVLSAQSKDQTTVLSWTTCEANTKQSFVVERSNDGVTYNKISVEVKQQANGIFKVEDHAPGFGKLYYRIRKTDTDSKMLLSNTVAIENHVGLQFNLRGYEGSDIMLSVSGRPGSRVKVSIFDLNGNRVGMGTAEMKTQKQDIIIKLATATSSHFYAIQVANESDIKSSIFRLN
jgi:hypothetical protein